MQNQTNYSVFLLKTLTMSNNIYCNTVVINNHTPKPTYKEILASPYGQPTVRAAQVPFYPNRSPLDCKRPNNDMVSGDNGKRMKGSDQRRANGLKPIDIPGNSANRAIGINGPGYYPNWQQFQKLKPSHGKANINNGRKGYYSEMNARRQMLLDTNGRNQHFSKMETPRVPELKTKVSENQNWPNMSINDKLNSNINQIMISHERVSKMENLPIKSSEIKAPERIIYKTREPSRMPKVFENRPSYKNRKIAPAPLKFYLNQLSFESDNEEEATPDNKFIQMEENQIDIEIETPETANVEIDEANVEVELDDNEIEAFKEKLSETLDTMNPAFKNLNQIENKIDQDVTNENYSNNSKLHKLELWRNQHMVTVDIKLTKPALKKRRKMPNYGESLIDRIEIYPKSNKRREKKIINLVKEIKRYNQPVLNGNLTRKYLKLKRLINERNEFYNLKIETTASAFITKLEERIHEAQRLGSTIDGTEITLKLLTENLMSHSKYNSFYQAMMVSNPGEAGVSNIVKLNDFKSMINQFDKNNSILKRSFKGRETGYTLEEEKGFKDPKPKFSKDIKDIKCYKCGKIGHYSNTCKKANSSNKVNGFKNKFKPKAYKSRGYNKGCYKCGGNHKSNECNYDFKKNANFNFNKNKKIEERAYLS